MPKIVLRDLDTIAKKWVDVTPGRAAYYEAGVRNPLEDWASEAIKAAPVYKAAVQVANIDKLYAGGVKMAGTPKWQKKATELGVPRFGPGVSAALDDYKNGFGPYHATLAALEIPERGPRGSDANWEISKKVGKALAAKRIALKAAGT
ncbi:MAG: hypothetical protein QXI58_05820 [Candidatus Micrarchaeia archaeon]